MDTDDSSNNSEPNIQYTSLELRETISMLKTYISLLESATETSKVDQSQVAKESWKLLHDAATSHDESDVQTELCRNISQFAKVQCIDFERNSRFIFEISNPGNITRNDSYTMEVLIDGDGRGKLGKCVLPDFINVTDILWRYPIDDLNNVKHILKTCQLNIDCYFRRLKQVIELKNLFLKIQNGFIYHNNNVTLIRLAMHNVKDVYTSDTHDAAVYLHYHTDETRPYKLSATTINVEGKRSLLHRRLNMYFMPFLKKDLSLAFMQIISSYVEFIWQKVIVESKENVELYEYEDKIETEDDSGYVDIYLCRRDKSLKRKEGEM
ncbi:uncharacterized protein LOC105203798 [Solenopsis invicta]|uniref:uncharacterized protein LOC105203798 n=1 Tax=Solenopsis invicta TaxID=13686 RepID=UPI00193E4309|nr:uncharacterized protein LOC105203798 [Solenopsis invicta]